MIEYERHAKLKLGKGEFDYFAGGACDMITLRENRYYDLQYKLLLNSTNCTGLVTHGLDRSILWCCMPGIWSGLRSIAFGCTHAS